MDQAGGAHIQATFEALTELGLSLPLFTQGYWTCDKGHRFDKGRFHSPQRCVVCNSPLFKWVPGPSISDREPPVILTPERENLQPEESAKQYEPEQ